MRIAFVGKGGAGKSTVAASFASYLKHNTKKPIMVVDADLNIHAPELLGLGKIPVNKHLSHTEVANSIKKWLIHKNPIHDLGAFRKTTPPTSKSNILKITELDASPLIHFGVQDENLMVFAVGSYQDNTIGASCYHNNLSIFESILNHLDDKDGYVIADMVAGVDAFAGTLHAQFDLVCFVAEATKRGVDVFKDYEKLAKKANVLDGVIVIGNKVRDSEDEAFLKNEISADRLFGVFQDDAHIRTADKTEGKIEFYKLHTANQDIIQRICRTLDALPDMRNMRLQKIYDLHEKYVSQSYVKDKYGDLRNQIEPSFTF